MCVEGGCLFPLPPPEGGGGGGLISRPKEKLFKPVGKNGTNKRKKEANERKTPKNTNIRYT